MNRINTGSVKERIRRCRKAAKLAISEGRIHVAKEEMAERLRAEQELEYLKALSRRLGPLKFSRSIS